MSTSATLPGGKIYIVEHLDPELGPWSTLEYLSIARETSNKGSLNTSSTDAGSISAHDLEYQKQLSRIEQGKKSMPSDAQRSLEGWPSLAPSQFILTSLPE
jgi:ribosome biogenesis SPOUT family RNA methylase Rps3